MSVHQEYGFVVRNFYPQQQKVCIVFRDRGKIALPIKDQGLCRRLRPGMLVSSLFQFEKKGALSLSSIEILGFFTCHSHEEVQWVHLIIELIYFFSPLDNPCHELFLFLVHYFKLFHQVPHGQEIQRAFFIAGFAKLLELLDFQVTSPIRQSVIFFDYLLANSIDFGELQNIKSISRSFPTMSENLFKEICRWGLTCLKSHPQFVYFKTLDILK